MVQLTETAVSKVKEILGGQAPQPAGLRIAVVGGGCSGFSYSMAFENTPNMLDKTYTFGGLKVFIDQASMLYLDGANMLDKTYTFGGLKVFIDQASMLYLDGAEVDYVEGMEGSGFKFNNPNVK